MKTKLVSTALLLLAFSTTVFAQTSNNPATMPGVIHVTGTAQVEAIPDEALVRIGILRQSTGARDAQDEASRIGQAILKAVGALGVSAQRIQTSRLSITPVYGQPRPGSNDAPRITGYMASNSVTVTLENLAQIGPVVDAGLDNGANQLEGVQFRLKNDGPVREQALRAAVAEARGKAVAIANALQVNLGAVLEVSESGVSISPMEERGGAVYAMAARAQVATPVSPGQLEINATVTVKYLIAPKN